MWTKISLTSTKLASYLTLPITQANEFRERHIKNTYKNQTFNLVLQSLASISTYINIWIGFL